MTVRFRPFDADFLQQPYPTYARLRDEDPIHRIRFSPLAVGRMVWRFARERIRQSDEGVFRTLRSMGQEMRAQQQRSGRRFGRGQKFFALSRYEDVSYALRHAELFSSAPMGGAEARPMNERGDISPTAGSLIGIDPPEHGRHRGIVSRGFTPRRIAALEPRIRKVADELVSAFEPLGRCELMEEFANPLPVSVIAELLGLDPARRDDFKRWSTTLIVGSTQGDRSAVPRLQMFREFRGYMASVVEERKRVPGDDLISILVHAGEGEGVLSTDQVISFSSLLLAAGSETTTNLIGSAMKALSEHPETLERVRAKPALIPQLVEEVLRYDSPIQMLMRATTQPVQLADTTLPAGSMTMLLLAAANRDERRFPAADRFDIDRDTNGHLGFGFGNHFCLGASLARLEGRIALETLLERLGPYEITAPVRAHGSFLVRGPAALPLRFGRRAAA
jgi:cytochrome P450